MSYQRSKAYCDVCGIALTDDDENIICGPCYGGLNRRETQQHNKLDDAYLTIAALREQIRQMKEDAQKTDNMWHHPEQLPHEVLLTTTLEEEYHRIDWNTKRRGLMSFDSEHDMINPNERLIPVFVSKYELQEKYQTLIQKGDSK